MRISRHNKASLLAQTMQYLDSFFFVIYCSTFLVLFRNADLRNLREKTEHLTVAAVTAVACEDLFC